MLRKIRQNKKIESSKTGLEGGQSRMKPRRRKKGEHSDRAVSRRSPGLTSERPTKDSASIARKTE